MSRDLVSRAIDSFNMKCRSPRWGFSLPVMIISARHMPRTFFACRRTTFCFAIMRPAAATTIVLPVRSALHENHSDGFWLLKTMAYLLRYSNASHPAVCCCFAEELITMDSESAFRAKYRFPCKLSEKLPQRISPSRIRRKSIWLKH